jgi:hypothetical protein
LAGAWAMSAGTHDANRIIEEQLDDRLGKIEQVMNADAFCYIGPIAYGIEESIKFSVEDIQTPREKLVVLLETFGGYIETADTNCTSLT